MANFLVRWTRSLEEAAGLDGPVALLQDPVESAFGRGARGQVLRGEWLGHALHPLLTDLVIGTWTSAHVLDLVGGDQARGAARTLVGAGLLAAAPTAWTGWAEWSRSGLREQRVGVVHAVANGLAIGTYAASWLARRRGDHAAGVRLGLAGATLSGAAAYLGGHLATARKVGSRHPAFEG